jgi:hypothetical protein
VLIERATARDERAKVVAATPAGLESARTAN